MSFFVKYMKYIIFYMYVWLGFYLYMYIHTYILTCFKKNIIQDSQREVLVFYLVLGKTVGG